MAKIATVEVWMLIDENGDFEVAEDQEMVETRYEDNVGELGASGGIRYIRLTITIPLPDTIEIGVDVPATEKVPIVQVR